MSLVPLGLLLLSVVRPGDAAGARTTVRPSGASTADRLRVEVLTMGPGAETYSRFGHSAVRLTLEGKGDIVFDFGTFDADQPHVVWRFLQARLPYWVSFSPYREVARGYRSAGRRITAQQLALTPAQRRDLFRRLRHLSRPENRSYAYDHFRANCATRVRDVLDRVTGGALRRQLTKIPARTRRWWIRRATRGAPTFHLAFDLFLVRADAPVSMWDACFSPEGLRAALARVRLPDERWAPDETRPLVQRTRVLEPGPDFGSGPGPSPWLWLILGALVLALPASILALAHPASALTRWIGGIALILGGLLAAVAGSAMTVMWAFTALPVFHGNFNILLFPPTHLLVAAAGLLVIRGPRRGRGLPRWLFRYAALHLAAVAAGYPIWRLAASHPQANAPFLLVSLTLGAAFVLVTYRNTKKKESPSRL